MTTMAIALTLTGEDPAFCGGVVAEGGEVGVVDSPLTCSLFSPTPTFPCGVDTAKTPGANPAAAPGVDTPRTGFWGAGCTPEQSCTAHPRPSPPPFTPTDEDELDTV